jgi:hypothetical protein
LRDRRIAIARVESVADAESIAGTERVAQPNAYAVGKLGKYRR